MEAQEDFCSVGGSDIIYELLVKIGSISTSNFSSSSSGGRSMCPNGCCV